MAGCSESLCGNQINAFQSSTNNVAPSELLLVICSVLAVVCLLWLAWLSLASFRAWQEGKGTFYDMMLVTLRGAVMTLLVGFFFIP